MIRALGYMPASLGGLGDSGLDVIDAAASELSASGLSASDTLIADSGLDVIDSAASGIDASGMSANPAPSAAGSAQLPGGSVFSYTASWGATIGLVGPDQVLSDLQAQLPSYGMSVAGSTINSGGYTWGFTGGSITVTVHDSIGHAHSTDAQSVLDSIVRNAVGSNLQSSNISVVSTPSSGAAAAVAAANGANPNPNPNLSTWFENNAGTVGTALVLTLLGGIALKKIL